MSQTAASASEIIADLPSLEDAKDPEKSAERAGLRTMFTTTRPASRGAARAKVTPIKTSKARRFPMPRSASASINWRFRPLIKKCGFVPIPTATFRRPAWTKRVASNTVIIRAGAKCATKPNSRGSSLLPTRCPRFASAPTPICASGLYRAKRFWRPSFNCWKKPRFAWATKNTRAKTRLMV